MRRPTRFVENWVIALAAMTVCCQQNQPPTKPLLSGKTVGEPGAAFVLALCSTDPEGQEIAYEVAWGDTTAVEWSFAYPSGETVRVSHRYPDSGSYTIRANARDARQAESGQSDSLVVTIGFLPPDQPSLPDGPTTCTTFVVCAFTTSAIHPFGDSVCFQFDWGGVAGNWSQPVSSGTPYTEYHTFIAGGGIDVAVRAKDVHGGVSERSLPLAVNVVLTPAGPPRDLQLTAATDSTVRLAWTAPTEGVPDHYNVYFRDVSVTDFTRIDTTGQTALVVDPAGATGLYTVSAVYMGGEYFCADTLTTVPVHTAAVQLSELNAPGSPGYGWNRTDGTGRAYAMTVAANAAFVDFYVTDWDTGFSGPLYCVASPDLGPGDPGGTVPPAGWHLSRFTGPIFREDEPLPRYHSSSYADSVEFNTNPIKIGCFSADGYYGLVEFSGFDFGRGAVQAEAWFQTVRGLRLIKH